MSGNAVEKPPADIDLSRLESLEQRVDSIQARVAALDAAIEAAKILAQRLAQRGF